MTREYEMLKISNRIDLLKGRPKENINIIKKLERKLRSLETATAGPETV